MILQELRYVAAEVTLDEARSMPREVRHWWIEEMSRERREREDEYERRSGRKRVDV